LYGPWHSDEDVSCRMRCMYPCIYVCPCIHWCNDLMCLICFHQRVKKWPSKTRLELQMDHPMSISHLFVVFYSISCTKRICERQNCLIQLYIMSTTKADIFATLTRMTRVIGGSNCLGGETSTWHSP
jgi:hypothetical protein